MPKTYNSLTVANAAAGSAILASDHAKAFENINNYRVPPACEVYRSSTTSYTADAAITWQASNHDTESPSDPMWSSGTNPERITIRTSGLYLVTYKGQITCTATLDQSQPSIRVNGSGRYEQFANIIGGTSSLWCISAVIPLQATNYITCSVFISGGSSHQIVGNATPSNVQTLCSVAWLGQVS